MNRILKFENAEARIFCFDGGKEVEEFHVVVSICNPLLFAGDDLGDCGFYARLRGKKTGYFLAIWKRRRRK